MVPGHLVQTCFAASRGRQKNLFSVILFSCGRKKILAKDSFKWLVSFRKMLNSKSEKRIFFLFSKKEFLARIFFLFLKKDFLKRIFFLFSKKDFLKRFFFLFSKKDFLKRIFFWENEKRFSKSDLVARNFADPWQPVHGEMLPILIGSPWCSNTRHDACYPYIFNCKSCRRVFTVYFGLKFSRDKTGSN